MNLALVLKGGVTIDGNRLEKNDKGVYNLVVAAPDFKGEEVYFFIEPEYEDDESKVFFKLDDNQINCLIMFLKSCLKFEDLK